MKPGREPTTPSLRLPPNDPYFRDDAPDDCTYEPPALPGHPPTDPCNLIMKGGVTSGVVFPGTVRVLATQYRFRRLGGTSAGAIAASLTAAAEYSRRATGNSAAFDTLWQISGSLGEARQGITRLEALFAPNHSTRSLHRLITTVTTAERDAPSLPVRLLRGLALTHPLPTALALTGTAASLLGAAQLLTSGSRSRTPLATSLAGTWLALGSVGVLLKQLTMDNLRRLEDNHLGLATGLNAPEAASFPSFTHWLNTQLQTLSGLGPDGPLLTFGALPPAQFARLNPKTPAARKLVLEELDPEQHREYLAALQQDIELRLITTNLAAGRPMSLPLDGSTQDGKAFYFRPDEWAKYFPSAVLDHLQRHSERQIAVRHTDAQNGQFPYYRLPPPAQLPVVVATRMSMSFPLLFSTVPLYAIDWFPAGAGTATQGTPAFSRRKGQGISPGTFTCHAVHCGDGGLTSNFPLALFDELVPTEPTFAVNLEYGEGARNGPPYAPTRPHAPRKYVRLNYPGFLRPYGAPDPGTRQAWEPQPRTTAAPDQPRKLLDYLMDILESARNWSDNAMISLPGYSERIAHVTINPGLGGTNLKMNDIQIRTLRHRGARAGELLLQRFRHPTGLWNWNVHQAATFLTLTADLERLLQDYALEYAPNGTLHVPGLPDIPFPGFLRSPLLMNGTWNASGALRLIAAGQQSTTVRGFRRLRGKRAVLRYRASS